MAKEKTSKAVQNRHIYSRASYLYQAAAYLAAQDHGGTESASSDPQSGLIVEGRGSIDNTTPLATKSSETAKSEIKGLPATPTTQFAAQPYGTQRHLLTHLRGISRKSQLRLSQDIKRSVCKRCDVLLIPGKSSSASVENASRGGKKEWADVYVVRCLGCGGTKRFPIGMQRQKRKGERNSKNEEVAKVQACELVHEKIEAGRTGDAHQTAVVEKGDETHDVTSTGQQGGSDVRET